MYKFGDRVIHKHYGEGVVIKIYIGLMRIAFENDYVTVTKLTDPDVFKVGVEW